MEMPRCRNGICSTALKRYSCNTTQSDLSEEIHNIEQLGLIASAGAAAARLLAA